MTTKTRARPPLYTTQQKLLWLVLLALLKGDEKLAEEWWAGFEEEQ